MLRVTSLTQPSSRSFIFSPSLSVQQPFIRAQLNPDFFLVLFPDNMRIGVAATQVCGMAGFLLGKTGIRTFEPLQAVAHPVLAPLVL